MCNNEKVDMTYVYNRTKLVTGQRSTAYYAIFYTKRSKHILYAYIYIGTRGSRKRYDIMNEISNALVLNIIVHNRDAFFVYQNQRTMDTTNAHNNTIE